MRVHLRKTSTMNNTINTTLDSCVEVIERQMSVIDALIGKREWNVVESTGDEILSVATGELDDSSIKKLQEDNVPGNGDQYPLAVLTHVSVDTYYETGYAMIVYANPSAEEQLLLVSLTEKLKNLLE